ncbi:MAG: ABC transporter ATP-binding protein [Clostridiaceae bacterium]|nr:ABC transporter ATP-binding protein [Clostridiaceae bacterium]
MNFQSISTIAEAKPLIIAVAIYSTAFLTLSLVTIFLEKKKFAPFMQIRMDKLSIALKKIISSEFGFFENSNYMDYIRQGLNAFSSTNSGLEGIYHEVFSVGKSVVAFILLSIILGKVNSLIPIIGVVTIIVTSLSQRASSKYHSELMPEYGEIDRKLGYANDKAGDFSYGKDIRVFDLKDRFSRLVDDGIDRLDKLQKRLRKKKMITSFPTSLGFTFLSVGIVYVLGVNFQNDSISIANLVMILSIIVIYIAQIIEIGRVTFFVMEQSIYLGISFDIEDSKTDISGGLDIDIEMINPEIIFDNVSFKYPNSDTKVLENLSLIINPGESVALVGINGAGKTTLVNLITGLYQPTEGKIYVGEYDLSTLSQNTLNELIAVVLQEFEPLALSVKENVAATTGAINDQLVTSSLEKAGILPKIESYDHGIDSMMLRVVEDEGVVLSGGENQKLSIARALYKEKAKILILDEPTSALDAIAEEQIYQNFESMIAGKTGIFISHRLASTRFCDKILLLNDGKIEQIGSHAELLKEDGHYKKMYETQASYYKGDKDGKNN